MGGGIVLNVQYFFSLQSCTIKLYLFIYIYIIFILFVDLALCLCRAVCRKHELCQFELEMAAQDLVSKKQQREELATGVSLHQLKEKEKKPFALTSSVIAVSCSVGIPLAGLTVCFCASDQRRFFFVLSKLLKNV